MTTNVSPDSPNLKRDTHTSIWTGALLIVLGLVAIVLPNISTFVAETWLALILISTGSAKLFYSFQTRDQGGFVWKLVLSILYIGTGVMLFTNPLTGVLTLTLLLGSFLLAEGAFNLILAFRLRHNPNWFWVLVDGIVTLALGAFIWFGWPTNAPWLLGTAVGASILSTGFSRVMLALNANPAPSQPDQTASA
ncbi:HdeD family acid-resistance protein [Leptolyngbya sp. FACHB-261]|uniref:HdeD family acid-resistance protein n=1 Tax=Leptolyngbya sp. FACHB-261 TaxID=2692806 RepID=UPI0016870161|nr:DUF308 domain-containing protein [Leptolyngbya sp. FACHB-261]MBD2103584.1 DUF308 domain-containing protein [Leptolyngbya sp. FACHB-261]